MTQIDFRYSQATVLYLIVTIIITMIIALFVLPILFFLMREKFHWNFWYNNRMMMTVVGMVFVSFIHIREKRCTAIFGGKEMQLRWKRKMKTIAYRDIYNVRYIIIKDSKDRERYELIIKTRDKTYPFRTVAENPIFWKLREEKPLAKHAFHYLQEELAKHVHCGITVVHKRVTAWRIKTIKEI